MATFSGISDEKLWLVKTKLGYFGMTRNKSKIMHTINSLLRPFLLRIENNWHGSIYDLKKGINYNHTYFMAKDLINDHEIVKL